MSRVVVGYWILFWLLNGSDKFLNGRDLWVFHWFGKDRMEQFGEYFDRIALPEEWIEPVLWATGAWEIGLAGLFAAAGLLWLRRNPGASGVAYRGLCLTALTFAGFSAFDVVAGDRAELLEHGTFFGIAVVSWLALRTAGPVKPTVNEAVVYPVPEPAMDQARRLALYNPHVSADQLRGIGIGESAENAMEKLREEGLVVGRR